MEGHIRKVAVWIGLTIACCICWLWAIAIVLRLIPGA